MKHIYKFSLILGATLLISFTGYTKSPAKTVFIKAEDAYFEDNLQLAAKLYEQVLTKTPNHVKSHARLGDIYLELKQPAKAVAHLKQVLEKAGNYNKEIQQQLAEAYQQNYEFDLAISQYFDLLKRVKRDAKAMERYHKRIAECAAGKQLLAQEQKVKLNNMGAPINSASADHVPVLTNNDNTLLFTSRRPKGAKRSDLYSDEDVFYTTRTGTDWAAPARFSKPINTTSHDAVLAVSPDGTKMYVYKDNENGGDIYETQKNANNSWKAPVKLAAPLNSKYYEPSVFISKDGNYAFFASNRPGGFGGLDLYLTVLGPNGTWSEAMNLGSSINTAYDEDAPFLNADNTTLYFSSKGHNSMGGYDVFQSSTNGAAWSIAQNMGSPVNSPADDIFYVQTQDGKSAYFASDRPGGFGGSDIYAVHAVDAPVLADENPAAGTYTAMVSSANEPRIILESTLPAMVRTKNILTLTGFIKDAQTGDTLEAQVTLLDRELMQKEGTLETSKNMPFTFTLDKSKSYGLLVQAEGYTIHSQLISVLDKSEPAAVNMPVALTKANKGAAVALQNISFYADQDMLKSQSIAELEWLYHYLENNPDVIVTLADFSNPEDTIPNKAALNAKRLKAITKYLTSKGLENGRITKNNKAGSSEIAGQTGLLVAFQQAD